jgi:putative ABC transport system permease protein
MMIMARSLIHSLETTRREYYEANRFGEVFAALKRAPNALAARIAEIPGVAAVQPGIAVQVTLDIPGLDEPASGNVRSVPNMGQPELNRLFLRSRAVARSGGQVRSWLARLCQPIRYVPAITSPCS